MTYQHPIDTLMKNWQILPDICIKRIPTTSTHYADREASKKADKVRHNRWLRRIERERQDVERKEQKQVVKERQAARKVVDWRDMEVEDDPVPTTRGTYHQPDEIDVDDPNYNDNGDDDQRSQVTVEVVLDSSDAEEATKDSDAGKQTDDEDILKHSDKKDILEDSDEESEMELSDREEIFFGI